MKIITKTKKIENKLKKKGTIQSQPKVKISNFAKFLKIGFKKIIQQQNFCLPTRLHAKWFAAGKYPSLPSFILERIERETRRGRKKIVHPRYNRANLAFYGISIRFLLFVCCSSRNPSIFDFLPFPLLSLPATEEIGITGSKNGLFKGQGREIKYIYLGQCLRANTILYANSRILELFCVT